MSAEVSVLVLTALSVGFLHTVLGPDHYVPFAVMGRSNQWSPRKTLGITALCGVGHILGSIAIGAIGLLLGILVFKLEAIESFRGDAAGWLLIGFGLAYLSWGMVHAVRNIPHSHLHCHADGTVHTHEHQHDLQHRHLHEVADSGEGQNGSMTPWILFLIFAFGPCEVLIPLLMYPAAEANLFAIVAVVLAFAVATIATMLVSVMLLTYGLQLVRVPHLQRFSHALAGLAVLLCGVMVQSGL